MIFKKNPKFDLEKKRSYFTQIGLVVSITIVIIAFEWRTYDQKTPIKPKTSEKINAEVIDILLVGNGRFLVLVIKASVLTS